MDGVLTTSNSHRRAFSLAQAGAALVLLLLTLVWWLRVISLHPDLGNPWWDWRIYKAALDLMASNGDPYDLEQVRVLSDTNMAFIAPPLAARMLQGINWLLTPAVFGPALLFGCVASYFACVFLLTRMLYKEVSVGLLLLTLATSLAAFKGGGVQALLGANMSMAFHLAIILAVYHGVRSSRWAALYAAVFICTLFKPYFALYLIFPVLLNGWSWREFWTGCGVVAAAAAFYVVASLAFPEQQALFIRNLTQDTFDKLGFFGETAFNAGMVTFGSKMAGSLSSVVFAGLVLLYCTFRLPRHTGTRIAVLFCVAVLLNPRVNHYDAFVASVPMAYLIARALSPYLGRRWADLPLASAVLVFVSFLYKANHPILSWVVCLLLVAVLAVSRDRPARDDEVVTLREQARAG